MMFLLLKFGCSSWEKTGLSPFLQSSGRSKGLSQREGEKLKITLYTYLHLNLPIFTYILFKVNASRHVRIKASKFHNSSGKI